MDHHLLAIRVFNRVVETGGFTRAADSLGMPKATVTKLIQSLEDHLQTKLFQRTTRSVSVTREGECYYQNTVKWLADLEQMEGCLTESQSSPQGVLRIDTGGGTAPAAAARAARFSGALPADTDRSERRRPRYRSH